jgi:hypothetical protein
MFGFINKSCHARKNSSNSSKSELQRFDSEFALQWRVALVCFTITGDATVTSGGKFFQTMDAKVTCLTPWQAACAATAGT